MPSDKPITEKRISELASEAYRLCGYQTVRFGDGSVGVLKCSGKTITLMNTFQALLMKEVSGE